MKHFADIITWYVINSDSTKMIFNLLLGDNCRTCSLVAGCKIEFMALISTKNFMYQLRVRIDSRTYTKGGKR